MRFWDTSAVVGLCAKDRFFDVAAPLLKEDEELTVWWGTRPECVSTFRRRVRRADMSAAEESEAMDELDDLSAHWSEVLPSSLVRAVAERLLNRYVLSAADALQLAAALDWAGDPPMGAELVTFDDRLAQAARAEGFRVLPA